MRIDKHKVQLAMLQEGIARQSDLADKAGLSPNTLSSIMRGARPKLETLKKLSAALGLDPADLIAEEPAHD